MCNIHKERESVVGKDVKAKIASTRSRPRYVNVDGEQYRVETIKKRKERKVGDTTVIYNEFEQKLVKLPDKEKKKKGKKKRK